MSNSNYYSNSYATPLDVAPHISRSVVIFFASVTLAAMLATAMASFSLLVKSVLLVVAGGVILRTWRNVTGRSRVTRIQRLNGEWRFVLQDGSLREGELVGWSYLSRWLVVVALKPDGQHVISVPVPWDALSPDQHRQLRRAIRLSSVSE